MKIGDDGAKAHDSFNPDEHHNPQLMCSLEENNNNAYKARACKLVMKAFVEQRACSKEELLGFCDDLLRDIDFPWLTNDQPWWTWME